MRPEQLLSVSQPDWTTPDAAARPLHEALDTLFEALKPEAGWGDASQSVRRMFVLNKILDRDEPLIRHVRGLLRQTVDRLMEGLHSYRCYHRLPSRPHAFRRFGSWVLYSDLDGYNVPHIHPKGLLSGVYYVAADYGASAQPDDGALRLRHGLNGNPDCPGWPAATIPTAPGSLVIMPSYYTHERLAVERPCRRVCLVFDVEFSSDSVTADYHA